MSVIQQILAGYGTISTGLDPESISTNVYTTPISGATNGNTFATWPDTKGSNNLGSGLATYRTNYVNGLAVGDLAAVAAFTSGGASASAYPRTAWAVLRPTSFSGNPGIFGTSGGGSGGLYFRLSSTGFPQILKSGVSNIATSSVGLSLNTWALVIWRISSSGWAIDVSGVSGGTGSHSTTLTASRTRTLGGDFATGALAEPYTGQFGSGGEDVNLWTDTQCANVWTFIKAKYALP